MATTSGPGAAATPAAEEFDLVVVGGGINGAGIAREAAGRDLRVCLIEQHDLAAHTSSASTKLIHGGLRYLEQGELRLVREALAERERLLGIAPHIIRPLRFVLPYVDGLRPRWLLRLGLFVYDHAGAREKLAASGPVELAGTALGAPLQPSLRDGFEYSDCWVDDSRLVVLNALDAAERGATVHTRTTVTGARDAGGHWVVHTRDAAGRGHLLRARVLVNAAGAWVNEVLDRMQMPARQQLRLVQGSHLILRRLYAGDHAYLLQSADRRVVFMIPYQQDFTLVGTTDVPYAGDPARPVIADAERDYLLACINRFLRHPAGVDDIRGSFSGVRPLYDSGEAAAQKVSRDYHLELQQGPAGTPVLSVYGGKITTYRRLAEHAFEMLAPALGREPASWTAAEPLPGGDIPGGNMPEFIAHTRGRWPALPAALLERLAHAYGTRVAALLGGARHAQDLGRDFGAGLTEAEVRYLVRHEWARSASDILWRRTRLGLMLPGSAVNDLQDAVAQLL
ncbi:MAG TPA: glycerol-3-phosphate dehydrogenase [Steroidobacteraceae bacterium]|nr:glycerol-3-phosphate dehydrogenase [Steroidobacteraceae bacterium]